MENKKMTHEEKEICKNCKGKGFNCDTCKYNEYENKICIGIPHTGTFPWNTVMSLLAMKMPTGWQLVYHMVGSCLVYDAREKIVKFARDNKCKYTMMLDSDMVPPNDTILKFVALLEAKKEIDLVTGTIFKRTPPFQPCFYTKLEYDMKTQKPTLESPIVFPDEGILALAGVGMACCMIRTDIFDRIDEKKAKNMDNYFYPLPNLGEDLTFCLIARKVGMKMVCDLSINVGHVSTMPIEKEHYRSCYEAYKANNDGKPLFAEEGAK